MSMQSQFEREERILGEDLESGHITEKEYRIAINDMNRDYQTAAEDAAQQAYDDEMRGW